MDDRSFTVFEDKPDIKDKVAWYFKWVSSILLVLAMGMRATGDPKFAIFDLWLSFIGINGWLVVSILWNDRALILLNSVGWLILLTGILKSFV